MKAGLLLVGLVGWLAVPQRLSAQEPIRAGVVGRARVGQPAPELVLPYYTRAGAGPVDQPFRLGAELGRVVVVVFGPEADWGWWNAVGVAADSAWVGSTVAGVVRTSAAEVAGRVTGLGTDRLKLLPDSAGAAGRRFGVRRGGRLVVVVGDDGRVMAVTSDFDPRDVGQVGEVGKAVRAGSTR